MAVKLAGKVISTKDKVSAEELKSAKDKLIAEQNKRWQDKLKNK